MNYSQPGKEQTNLKTGERKKKKINREKWNYDKNIVTVILSIRNLRVRECERIKREKKKRNNKEI